MASSVIKFYYIFQWQYRKGYDILIKAFYSAFTSNDNVILILKTNKLLGTNEEFIEKVKEEIAVLKKGRGSLPEIFISTEFISKEEMSYLHNMCDVYVAPHRGEGWGMPIVQAAKEENIIITTNFGGSTEFLSEKSAIFIDYKKIQ